MSSSNQAAANQGSILLCSSSELIDGGLAVGFDVTCADEFCRAFAVRFDGRVRAYLNRCTHVAMELDWQPNRFFDASGQWLVCASHGAFYDPATGDGVAGPCNGGLRPIETVESGGKVFWLPDAQIQPITF